MAAGRRRRSRDFALRDGSDAIYCFAVGQRGRWRVYLLAVGLVPSCSSSGGVPARRTIDGGKADGGAGDPSADRPDPQAYADSLCAYLEKCDQAYFKAMWADA